MKEVLKLALEALETELAVDMTNGAEVGEAAEKMCEAITAIKEALAKQEQGEPVAWIADDMAYRPNGLPQEFISHEVESPDDWSEWVCPKPEQYFMKCCDCGLVHEAQFRVAKYSKGDECEFVADANLQAVFRVRRATPPAQEFVCSTGLCHYKATSDERLMEMPKQEPVGTLNIWFYKGHGNYDFEYWGSLGEGTYTVHAAKSEAPVHNSTCNETLRAQGKEYPRTCKKCGFGPCVGKPKSDTTPPAAQPAPVQEFVDGCACRWNSEDDRVVTCERHEGWLEVIAEWADRARSAEAKLKAIPPAAQRQWVGLTDEELDQAWQSLDYTVSWAQHRIDIARAIEAKLKERNHD
jgi:hypothetical protein